MKATRPFRAAVTGVAVLIAAWLVLGFITTEASHAIGGTPLVERLSPARSAHLLEEAHARTYSPVRDTPYLIGVATTVVTPFLLAAFFAARLNRHFASVFLLLAFGLPLELLLSHELLDPAFPRSIRLASFVQLLSALGAALLAGWLGARHTGPKSTEHGAA